MRCVCVASVCVYGVWFVCEWCMLQYVWFIVCIVWYGIYGMVYVFMYSVCMHSSIVYGVCVCLVLVCMVYESSSAEMCG